jgi:translation initiation factor eIF-2B subunit gamma
MNSDLSVVILAGPGHRMYPLIGGGGDDHHLHKCLLPIGNKPMILHLLSALQACSVGPVYILTAPRTVSKLSNVIRNFQSSMAASDPRVPILDIHVLPDKIEGDEHSSSHQNTSDEREEEESSPMHSLRLVKDKIKSDFVVLPCDLMVFGSNDSSIATFQEIFNSLADIHRLNNTLLSLLLLKCNGATSSKGSMDESVEPFDKVLAAYSEVPIVNNPTRGSNLRLLKLNGIADLEENISVRLGLLERFPRIRFDSDLVDLHWYIFSHSTLSLLDSQYSPNEWSIREDFIPRIIKASLHSTNDSFGCALKLINATGDSLIMRANTIQSLAECNRQYAIRFAPHSLSRLPASCEIQAKSTVGNDSMLGEHCRISDKVLIKRSVLGNHVGIGSGTKLVNNVLFDNVIVDDSCKIDGCLIGPKAVIHSKAVLKDCFVAPGAIIPGDSNLKGQSIGSSALGVGKEFSDLFV